MTQVDVLGVRRQGRLLVELFWACLALEQLSAGRRRRLGGVAVGRSLVSQQALLGPGSVLAIVALLGS